MAWWAAEFAQNADYALIHPDSIWGERHAQIIC
jgi:hypothetical protein